MQTAKAIHEEMRARGFTRDAREYAKQKYVGRLDINGRPISVEVSFELGELIRSPKVRLPNFADELPLKVAHIEDGNFCYIRDEEIVFDPLTPNKTTATCIDKLREALDRLQRLDLSDEIAAELPQHWRGDSVFTDLPSDFAGTAFLMTIPGTGRWPTRLVALGVDRLVRLGCSEADRKKSDRSKEAVAVVRVPARLTFKPGQVPPARLDQLLGWLNAYAPGAVPILRDDLAKLWPNPMRFLINAPNGLVGGIVELPKAMAKSITRPLFLRRMLEERSAEISVKRIHGSQIDPDFILRRNMADQPDLSGKKVCVVGIGTIGGQLSKFLAQSGAGMKGGSLTLFDTENLSAGNVGRHLLGVPDIGKSKAIAARDEIMRHNPDGEIRAFHQDVRERLAELKDYDLIVDATGERALSDVLNSQVVADRAAGSGVSYLAVWIVGGGVAVQALLVDDDQHACFRCLRLDDPSQERFTILRADHPVALTPANCGEGSYFAYGVGASAIAAGLANQMALGLVAGAPSPRFRTIRLVHEAMMDVKSNDVPKRSTCPACAGPRG